jgi:hypothetical protein
LLEVLDRLTRLSLGLLPTDRPFAKFPGDILWDDGDRLDAYPYVYAVLLIAIHQPLSILENNAPHSRHLAHISPSRLYHLKAHVLTQRLELTAVAVHHHHRSLVVLARPHRNELVQRHTGYQEQINLIGIYIQPPGLLSFRQLISALRNGNWVEQVRHWAQNLASSHCCDVRTVRMSTACLRA